MAFGTSPLPGDCLSVGMKGLVRMRGEHMVLKILNVARVDKANACSPALNWRKKSLGVLHSKGKKTDEILRQIGIPI